MVEQLSELLHRKSEVVASLDRTDSEKESLMTQLERQKLEIARISSEREKLLKEEEELKDSVKDLEIFKEALDRTKDAKITLESKLKDVTQERDKLHDC